jgi:hypothetical protein
LGLVLVHWCIFLVWGLSLEVSVLNVLDKANHLLPFDLHMILKLFLVHLILVSETKGILGITNGQLYLVLTAAVGMEVN